MKYKVIIAIDANYTAFVEAKTEEGARQKALVQFEEISANNPINTYEWSIHEVEEAEENEV